jgi:2-(1,2-epoxy-1,2-dihydrophenyl)acetyl-CoA isomerase
MAILDESTSGAVAVLTLNRPDRLNALDLDLADALAAALVRIRHDPALRAVVLTGTGSAFCAGGDLRWVASHPGGLPAGFYQLAGRVHTAIMEIRRLPKPVIAALNGVAAGGGFSLALACDFRVMADTAKLRQGYTSNGLSIDAGGTFTLPRLVGLARALEIAAFDEPIDAEQALDWGLATRVTTQPNVMAESIAMAEALAQRSVNAFGEVKALLMDSFETPLEAQLEAERRAIAASSAHPEGHDRVTAFLAKRAKPA